MKPLSTIYLCLITGIGALILSGCENEEVCAPADAAFSVYQPFDEQKLELDTFVAGNLIYLEALGEFDSLHWNINNQTFTRNPFDLNIPEGERQMDITLTVYKQGAGCSEQQEVATLSKTIYVVPADEQPLLGRYLAYDPLEPENKFEIEVSFSDTTFCTLVISNFPKLCILDKPAMALASSSMYRARIAPGCTGHERFRKDFTPVTDLAPGCGPLSSNFSKVSRAYLNENRDTLTIDYHTVEGFSDDFTQIFTQQRQVIASRIN